LLLVVLCNSLPQPPASSPRERERDFKSFIIILFFHFYIGSLISEQPHHQRLHFAKQNPICDNPGN